MSQKPAEGLDLVMTNCYMQGRDAIPIHSVHTRPQVLKLCHRSDLSARCSAMHESTDQKGVGIGTDAKMGVGAYLLKISPLNGSNHAIGTGAETPYQSRSEGQQEAR